MSFIKELCRFRPPAEGRLVIWELTDHCNLACAHCCTNSSPQVSREHDAGLSDIVRSIREFEEAGVKEVYFSGGEPFVRPDFVDILEAACEQPVEVFVATNGTLVTPERLRRIAAMRVRTLTISLDGHTAELHNFLRRSETAFSRAVQGIRYCVEEGVPIRVSHMITPENSGRIGEFCDFVVGLGVTSIALHAIIPAGRAREERETILGEGTEDPILEAILAAQAQYGDAVKIDHGLKRAPSRAPQGCPAGAQVLHIAANGDVSTCSWLYKLDKARFTVGNLKRKPLSQCLADWRASLDGLSRLEEECPIPQITRPEPLRRDEPVALTV
jgi:MoaA/NifB/PqqE/SkfB family radical SAM enzyme